MTLCPLNVVMLFINSVNICWECTLQQAVSRYSRYITEQTKPLPSWNWHSSITDVSLPLLLYQTYFPSKLTRQTCICDLLVFQRQNLLTILYFSLSFTSSLGLWSPFQPCLPHLPFRMEYIITIYLEPPVMNQVTLIPLQVLLAIPCSSHTWSPSTVSSGLSIPTTTIQVIFPLN